MTNLSTESFMRLISDNLSFKDDSFQTVMVERNGYDRFYLQFSFKKTQKISTLHLERLNKDIVNKNNILIERTEGTGVYIETLKFSNNEPEIDHSYSQAKSHVIKEQRVTYRNKRMIRRWNRPYSFVRILCILGMLHLSCARHCGCGPVPSKSVWMPLIVY